MDLNQTTLAVADFTRSVEFYTRIGLKLIVRSESADKAYARFECPSGASTLSLHRADTVEPGGAALYFEVDDVDAAVARLTAAGIAFETQPTDQSWRWREAWFRDPDGRRLCIYHAGPDRRFPPWRIEDGPAPE